MKKINIKNSSFKKSAFLVGILSFLTIFMTISCNDDLDNTTYFTTETMTLVETMESMPEDFSSYVEILIKTGYYNALSSYGKYTCFVPENYAVTEYLQSEWGVSTVDEMQTDEQLAALDLLVRFHTMPSRKYRSSFVGGRIADTTFSGDFLTTSYPEEGATDGLNVFVNKEALTVALDIAADNGVIHSLNKVLTPYADPVPAVIAKSGKNSIFSEALVQTGYDVTFSQNVSASGNNLNFTLFVESDSVYALSGINSFEDLAAKYSPGATDYTEISNGLNRFIAYHATSAFLYALDLPDDGFVSTILDGNAIKVFNDADDKSLKLNESETGGNETWTTLIISESNNPAKNGVYHTVDTLFDIFTPSAKHIIFDVVNDQPEYQSKLVSSHQYNLSTVYENVSWYPEKTQRFLKSSDKSAYGDGTRFDLNGCIWYEFVTPIIPKGKYELLICALGRSSSRGQFQIYWDDEPIGGIYDLTRKATSLGMSADASYNLGGANEGLDSAAMEAYNWRRGFRDVVNRDGASAFDDAGACRYIITKELLCPVQKMHRIKLVAVKAGVVPLDYIEWIPVIEN